MILTWHEVMFAAHVGLARNVSAMSRGRQLEPGRNDLGFERHVEGAIGEYAVARMLDCCWRPLIGELDTATGDLAGLQIKTTTRATGCLIVRPHDPPEFLYVLVLIGGADGTRGGLHVDVVGGITGRDAKVAAYWRERDPAAGVHAAAHFVPKSELRPLYEVRALEVPF